MTWERQVRQAFLVVVAVALALMAFGLVVMLGAGLLHLPILPSNGGARSVAARMGLALLLSGAVAALGAFGVASLLARLLAHALTTRLGPLIVWSRDIGRPAGDVGPPVDRADELGELAYVLGIAHRQLRDVATARETFLAAVAHDLRTPLTSLQGQLEAMVAGLVPPDPERLARLQTDVSRLIRLAEDLLLLFQAETGRLPVAARLTDLVGLTHHVGDRMAILADDRDITLSMEGPPAAFGSIDPDRMDQVLTNILANALTYCPAGSRVVVSLDVGPDRVTWRVHDNGPGIPPAILAHVTDPLVRGDVARAPGHVGLGLAIARAWVIAHAGQLTVTSDSCGTTVDVQVPIRPMEGD